MVRRRSSQTVALAGRSPTVMCSWCRRRRGGDAAIQAETDLTVRAVINFNGDDAIVLRNGGAVVDSFGQIGVDPGSRVGRWRSERHVGPQGDGVRR